MTDKINALKAARMAVGAKRVAAQPYDLSGELARRLGAGFSFGNVSNIEK